MRTLITGGTGLVGTYLKDFIPEDEYTLYLSSKNYDLTREVEVKSLFDNYSFDRVIHLAAHVGGIMDNINNPIQYLEDNVLMNTHILKYSRLHNVKKFVTTLSTCIYSDVYDSYPLSEKDIHLGGLPNENNLGYGYSKRLLGIEIDLLRQLKDTKNYSYIIPSNLYGKYEHGDADKKHFLGAVIQKIIDANKSGDDSITLYGTGEPLRQFTHAQDIAFIISEIMNKDINVNMNVATPNVLSIDKLAKLALKATDSEHLKIIYDSSKPDGQYRKDVSIDKFKKVFPNYNFISYIDGIRDTYFAKLTMDKLKDTLNDR